MAALDERLEMLDSLKSSGGEKVEVHLQKDVLTLRRKLVFVFRSMFIFG